VTGRESRSLVVGARVIWNAEDAGTVIGRDWAGITG
jgi:hypothetical protein